MKSNFLLTKFKNSIAATALMIPVLFISILIYQGCKEALVTPDEPTSLSIDNFDYSKVNLSELNADRTFIAKTLAKLLRNVEYRKVLKEEIHNANNREEILDASVFLNKIFNINSKEVKFISEMSKISSLAKVSVQDSKNSVDRIQKLHKGLIDIYFPIDEHRESWKSSDKSLYVAIMDHKIVNTKKGAFVGYDLNGNELRIDVNKVPEIPTLVVCTSETHGNYPPKESLEPFFGSLQKSAAVTSTNSETSTYTWHIRVINFFCRDDVGDQPWGAPEWYLNTWVNSGDEQYRIRTNFYDCVTSGHGYYGIDRIIYTRSSTEKAKFTLMDDDGGLAGEDDVIQDTWSTSDYTASDYYQWWPSSYINSPNPPIPQYPNYIHLIGMLSNYVNYETYWQWHDAWMDVRWQRDLVN